MAYDNLSYEILDRMPEWWKHDPFLEPINRYTQELIRDLIGGLLGSFGVVQPVQVWKTLPTEYSWTHTYLPHDNMLRYPEGGTSGLELHPNTPVRAYFPNSKRNCHAVIQIQLQGDDELGTKKQLEKLSIKNVNQEIVIKNITTTTDIKIFTEDGTILIDGVQRDDLTKGFFSKIYSQAINTNYDEVNIYDENKETYIEIESSEGVSFAIKTKLIHPVYFTEQNIRVHTVSAFPIEWIKLYGFYCNEFSNKQEWRFLWEKNYKESERVVYDMITKQFDCETFYVQVKLYGIGLPLVYGFPQEELASNPAFQTNKNLDKWGRIYGLPRRYYKTKISEDEERYTLPPFYNYDIEQDYWYEERLVNEYRHNDEAVNSALIKDSNLNNIAILQCIDPRIQDIYVYTETVKGKIDNNRRTGDIYPSQLDEEGEGVTWKTPHEIANTYTTASEVTLLPETSETINNKNNQTKILQVKFGKENMPELPKNIKIKGIELQLHGLTDIHSSSLTLDDRSQMLLPTYYTKKNGETFSKIDYVNINIDTQSWEKGKGVYTIGGENVLFNLQEIKREQLLNGLTFHLGFTNKNNFLKATIVLYTIKLIIHYEKLEDEYEVKTILDTNEIILSDDKPNEVKMKIYMKNTGKIPAVNKNVHIIVADGLEITNNRFPTIDLGIDPPEEFVIGDSETDQIIITPSNEAKTGLYDVIVFCNEKVIKNEIIIKERE